MKITLDKLLTLLNESEDISDPNEYVNNVMKKAEYSISIDFFLNSAVGKKDMMKYGKCWDNVQN